MTDHTRPDLEQRIAALEAITKHPVYVVPPLSDKAREELRSASGGRPIPAQPMNQDPAAWAQWAAKSGAQPVDAAPPATDDAAEDDEIPEDLARAINDARDGRAPTHEQVGVMLHYLVAGTAELEQARRERADLAVAVQEYGRQRDAAIARAEKAERERDALNETGLRQKPFLYALADITGQPHLDDFCVAEHPSHLAEGAEDRELNILPLYTGPQVIKMAEQRDEAIARAERAEAIILGAERLPDDDREMVRQRDEARAEAEKLAGLLREAREWVGISTIFKHDNASIAEVCDRIDAALAARKEGGA